jgi:ABC-type sugar transport system ATPase subunit
MARALLCDLGKRFGDRTVLDKFSLEAADGELITVVGPSGCGKSTLLRLIAGLEEPTSGTIQLGDRRVDTLPPDQRDVAMVFQSYALYPHMNVRGNIEFPLRMRGHGRAERRRQAEEIAALLELSDLLERRPAALSGGQRQRVALARALVRRPALFLLDEPLSNLDTRLRASVRRYIRDVQRRLGVTTLYVTHDQTEAMTLGDRVVVLDQGRIQQCGVPLAVYERPANTFVAGFIGSPPMNLLPATHSGGELLVGVQRVSLSGAARTALAGMTGRLTVGVRAEAFAPDVDSEAALCAQVVADSLEWLGGETLLRARTAGSEITVRLPGTVIEPPNRVAAPIEALHFFSSDGGNRIV